MIEGVASQQAQDVARRFAAAFEADDIDGLVELLSDDSWLAMPPAPHEYHGRRAIASFLSASAAGRGPRSLRLVATRANTQPAFYCYFRRPPASSDPRAGIVVLTLADGGIAGITRFLDPHLQRAFEVADNHVEIQAIERVKR